MISTLFNISTWWKYTADKMNKIIEDSNPDELESLRETNKKLDAYCSEHPEVVAEIMLKKYNVDYKNPGNVIYLEIPIEKFYTACLDTYVLDKIYLLYLKCYGMKKIYVSGKKFITSVPILPNLEEFYCRSTSITSIPLLPNLRILDCKYTRISTLPLLPKLEELQCTDSAMSLLPAFPELKKLFCNNTNIKHLPEFPEIEFLLCHNKYLRVAIPIFSPLKTDKN